MLDRLITKTDQPVTQLEMLRDHMDNLPEIVVPEGYGLRTFQEGDGSAWCAIMEGNVGTNWTVEKFESTMVSDPRFEPENLLFATCQGQPVASACAWSASAEEKETGQVHMVACLEDHRGKGLGHLLNAATLRRLKDLGYVRAHLQTDDFRLAAANSYLKAGFRPLHTHISHAGRWDEVVRKLEGRR